MRSNTPERGFSLVELMVTVAMVGVLAVIALPSVMEALQRRQVVDASQAVLDLVEYARVQAASRNRAYEIRARLGTGIEAGTLEVWENTAPACLGFTVILADGSTSTMARELNLTQHFPTVRLLATVPADLVDSPLCIKPDGRVFQVRNDTTPVILPSTDDFAGGDARYQLQRINKFGRAEGPLHAVVVPFSGLARVVVE